MPFEKGHNKTGGRAKKVPNKITQDLRESIRLLLEGEFGHLNGVLKTMRVKNPIAYANVIEKFMSYVVPRKRDITSDDQAIIPQITINEIKQND